MAKEGYIAGLQIHLIAAAIAADVNIRKLKYGLLNIVGDAIHQECTATAAAAQQLRRALSQVHRGIDFRGMIRNDAGVLM